MCHMAHTASNQRKRLYIAHIQLAVCSSIKGWLLLLQSYFHFGLGLLFFLLLLVQKTIYVFQFSTVMRARESKNGTYESRNTLRINFAYLWVFSYILLILIYNMLTCLFINDRWTLRWCSIYLFVELVFLPSFVH